MSTQTDKAPMFDPDGDGKPGISWPAATILIVIIISVAVLALNGALDLNRLLSGVVGAGGGAALMRLLKR